ncbi:general secretion pathway protein GspL [Duganella sp. FT94W]|uniref:General secretion pathway protein GspL n=1 Tax=Duganella lactea TaxID=2692173 RepID=A0ABW9V1V1_9BURK|nr:type II secretion system protein GspL [Duganella lactea]MYM32782.1 general secretion pathway protein GspL [Duganella lactea]
MTTLFIRYPAKASIDSGAAQSCPFALVGDGGNLLQQGTAPLGNLGAMVASARRVTLLLAASDVTLLRVKTPPLSATKLKAALPALVEEHVLGDPADCALAAGPADDDGMRTVAVVQRAWLEVLVKALVAQGAHAVTAVPSQLSLPFQPGAVSAALVPGDAGYDLAMRQSQSEGLGMTLPAQPQAALHTVRVLAGEQPVTLYVSAAQKAQFAPLAAEIAHLTLEEDHWAHWIAAARGAGLNLAQGVGDSGAAARAWQRWRWPLRIGVLALLVNVVGVNVEWLRLKAEAKAVNRAMLQTFKSVYPSEPLVVAPQDQMSRNIRLAKANSGEAGGDEFVTLSAAFGEALGVLPRKDIIATLDYKDHALLVKLKPNTVDAAAAQTLRQSLAGRKLEMQEPSPGTWRIAPVGAGAKS